MTPSSKRKNSEVPSQISKKKRTTKELEARSSNPREELESTAAGPSTTNDISNVLDEKPTQLIATTASEWHLPKITGGDVYYVPEFVDNKTANLWLSELTKLDTWYHPKLKVYGKEVSQSRSIAAYASDTEIMVKYSGHVVTIHNTYPHILSEIQKRVEDLLGETFNHVMLNRYKDGTEYIGKHRDTKENKVIVSLSLGAERTFIMTPNKPSLTASAHRWKLANGSLLVMKGETQNNWKHEIPKEPKIKDERISLTFRQLVSFK